MAGACLVPGRDRWDSGGSYWRFASGVDRESASRRRDHGRLLRSGIRDAAAECPCVERENAANGTFAEDAGIWSRSPDFAKILPMLREHWQPYIDGKSSLEEAMRRIAESW